MSKNFSNDLWLVNETDDAYLVSALGTREKICTNRYYRCGFCSHVSASLAAGIKAVSYVTNKVKNSWGTLTPMSEDRACRA